MDFEQAREAMVTEQIVQRGIRDERVLAAMQKVPRHLFMPVEGREYAYLDGPLRIGKGQTMSQPYIVALMTQLLGVGPEDKVLDVGTGSGYQAAVLNELAGEVHSIERIPALAELAAKTLAEMGCGRVSVHVGDGSLGYLPAAPYDGILVAAAAPKVPQALLDQLAEGGRLVIPVGDRALQTLEFWERREGEFTKANSISVVFVPLLGEGGWKE